jgi:hypothetical protein
MIPEVSGHHAPVAMEWDHVIINPYAMDRGQVYRREVRCLDGAFYTPFGTTGQRADFDRRPFAAGNLPNQENRNAMERDHFRDLESHELDDPQSQALDQWYSGGITNSKLADQKNVEVVSSEEEAERAAAEAIAGRFLIVDGQVYIRVAEPTLVVRTWRLPDPGAEITVDLESHGKEYGAPSEFQRVRPDEHHKIEDFVATKGVPLHRQEARNPIVHMPQAFAFNSSSALAEQTARYTLSKTRQSLGALGRRAGNAWYDLDEALVRFEADNDAGMLEEVMSEALPVIVEAVRAAGLEWNAQIEESVELWLSSEIALEIGDAAATLGMRR